MINHDDLSILHMNHKKQKNSVIIRKGGYDNFGLLPFNNNGFESLPIKLKLGLIGFGANRQGAYGVRHIFEKHKNEIGITCPSEIPGFIERIMISGADVIVDYNKDINKVLCIESKVGMVVFARKGSNDHYNIITAYDKRSHPGTLIARL